MLYLLFVALLAPDDAFEAAAFAGAAFFDALVVLVLASRTKVLTEQGRGLRVCVVR